MADRRTLELLKGRVRGDAKVASEGVALDICSQNEGRLVCGQFSCRDRFSTTPTREDGLSRYPQIAHPIHDTIRGGQIALPILLKNHDRVRTWLTACAPTHREQVHRVVPGSDQLDARAQQGRGQHISHTDKPRGLLCFCHSFLLLRLRRDVVVMTTTCDHHKERGLNCPFWDRSVLFSTSLRRSFPSSGVTIQVD